MQAQKLAPPDMVCKDKFLVQSTVVPEGTTDEDFNANMVSIPLVRYKIIGPQSVDSQN